MFLFYGNQLGNRLVKNLATGTTRKGGIYRRSGNHNRNVGRTLRRGLLGNTRLSISLEVQGMVRRLIGVLEFGLGPIDLERTASEISSPEISEPTTWEVTSARVQKHSLSTMLSKRADNDSFSSSNTFALNSDRSIRSFKALISAR